MWICWFSFVGLLVAFCAAMTRADGWMQWLGGISVVAFMITAIMLLDAGD